jgi:hypothetical protein
MKERIEELEQEAAMQEKDKEEMKDKMDALSKENSKLGAKQRLHTQTQEHLELNVKGVAELEAQLRFKENELMTFEQKKQSQLREYENSLEELKEELGQTKEKLIKVQKNEAALEIYKKHAEESSDLKRQLLSGRKRG